MYVWFVLMLNENQLKCLTKQSHALFINISTGIIGYTKLRPKPGVIKISCNIYCYSRSKYRQ